MPKQAVVQPYISLLVSVAGIVALVASSSAQTSHSVDDDASAQRSGQLCTTCHQPDPLFSHPVGIAPSMATPQELPLQGGRLTCITCHLDTGSPVDGLSSKQHAPLRLRMGTSQLCAECHDPANLESTSLHALNLGRAHLKWSPSSSAILGISPVGAHAESDSASCLSCHDGSVAQDIGHGDIMGFSLPGNIARALGSHPVDIEYRQTNRDADGPLVSVSVLDARIRLFDNRVTCGSCHTAYSHEQHDLVMSNLGSKLCLGCHQY